MLESEFMIVKVIERKRRFCYLSSWDPFFDRGMLKLEMLLVSRLERYRALRRWCERKIKRFRKDNSSEILYLRFECSITHL